MNKNILTCKNKNHRNFGDYSNPNDKLDFVPLILINNRRIDDVCLKENNSIQIKTQELDEEFKKIKEKLKKIDWYIVSNNWKVSFRKNQYSDYNAINLNPFQDCSPENPLYMHKEWVEQIYYDKDIQMTDEKIAKLCNITKNAAYYWRKKKHNIKGKEEWGEGRWIDNRSGRVYIRVPKDFNHPELKLEKGRKRSYRLEHIYIMEKYLSEHPEFEISQKYIIDGKYLKEECEIHHINFNPQDNRIENLWIYENKKAHAKGEKSIRNVFLVLIKINCILFMDGKYYLNQNFDFKCLTRSEIIKLESNQSINIPINNMSLNEVQEAIKKINWNNISSNWKVIKHYNQFKEEIIDLNPYKNCSDDNPLYMHKKWFMRIYEDPRFNLSDSKLGKICNITKDKARYWREKVHQIEGKKEWGKERLIDKSDGRVWIRVPKNYANPVVDKGEYHRRIMIEHRYLMEKFLAKHPEWGISKRSLIDGKYLKSKYEVHHINLDFQDNRIENLWVFETNEDHQEARRSLYILIDELIRCNFILFQKGRYIINI